MKPAKRPPRRRNNGNMPTSKTTEAHVESVLVGLTKFVQTSAKQINEDSVVVAQLDGRIVRQGFIDPETERKRPPLSLTFDDLRKDYFYGVDDEDTVFKYFFKDDKNPQVLLFPVMRIQVRVLPRDLSVAHGLFSQRVLYDNLYLMGEFDANTPQLISHIQHGEELYEFFIQRAATSKKPRFVRFPHRLVDIPPIQPILGDYWDINEMIDNGWGHLAHQTPFFRQNVKEQLKGQQLEELLEEPLRGKLTIKDIGKLTIQDIGGQEGEKAILELLKYFRFAPEPVNPELVMRMNTYKKDKLRSYSSYSESLRDALKRELSDEFAPVHASVRATEQSIQKMQRDIQKNVAKALERSAALKKELKNLKNQEQGLVGELSRLPITENDAKRYVRLMNNGRRQLGLRRPGPLTSKQVSNAVAGALQESNPK